MSRPTSNFRLKSSIAALIPICSLLAAPPAHALTFSEVFLEEVSGNTSPSDPYELFEPGEFEILDRIASSYDGTYSPKSGNGTGELPEDSPLQPRALSNQLSVEANKKTDATPMSNLAVAMFQFIASHEIARSPTNPAEMIDLPLQPGDENEFGNLNPLDMDRSQTTGALPREQLNDVTSAFDGSTVYGSYEARQKMLWETTDETENGPLTGFLLTSKTDSIIEPSDSDPNALPGLPKFLVPQGPTQVARPIAGDVRADENPTLEALHELFLLEHNRVAQAIFDDCDATGRSCSGEQVFYAAKSVVAKTQEKIFYDELLPIFLGTDDLETLLPDPALVGEIQGAINSFTAAAGRVGHTQVPDTIVLASRNAGVLRDVDLSECFFNRDCLGDASIEEILYGAATQNAEAIDLFVVDSLRNGQSPGFGADRNIDLLATNINRGRDHGIPDYLSLRAALGFDVPDTIAELLGLLPQSILEAYGILTDADIATNPIDALLGIFAEERSMFDYLGETGKALWALQFLGLQAGNDPLSFGGALASVAQIDPSAPQRDPLSGYLEEVSMASLLANNLGGTSRSFGPVFLGSQSASTGPRVNNAPVPIPPALAFLLAGCGSLVCLRHLPSRRFA